MISLTVEIKCDGDHPGFLGGELSDGDKLFCDECVQALKDKIEDLETELNTAKSDRDTFEERVGELDEQIEQMQKDLNEKTLANG